MLDTILFQNLSDSKIFFTRRVVEGAGAHSGHDHRALQFQTSEACWVRLLRNLFLTFFCVSFWCSLALREVGDDAVSCFCLLRRPLLEKAPCADLPDRFGMGAADFLGLTCFLFLSFWTVALWAVVRTGEGLFCGEG